MVKLCFVVLLKCWYKSVAMIIVVTLCSQAVVTPVEKKWKSGHAFFLSFFFFAQ